MAEQTIITVSKPFPDGQRVTSVAIEYPAAVRRQDAEKARFAVEGRSITGVLVADTPDAETSAEQGKYVILTLDKNDPDASTVLDLEGRHISAPRPRPAGGPGGGGGPRERVLPDGRVFKGPSGLHDQRPPLAVPVTQKSELAAADGTVYPAWTEPRKSNQEINVWADLFTQERFRDIEYNLFVPADYDPSKKYPLLLFIHDAGVMGVEPRITLEQGIGATIFASPEEQKKHPCIVVAPQHAKELPIANDMYWCLDDLYTYKDLLDDLQARYSVDPDRIYTTGQSMGFMTSLQLLIEYPDYFGGALLPAGHWDREKTAQLWRQNVWMFLSDLDRGGVQMFVLPELIEKLGGKLGYYLWDADQPTEALSELVRSVENDGNSFRITRFTGESILRKHQPDRTDGGGHNGTWHLVYQIEAARDWLFAQRRNG